MMDFAVHTYHSEKNCCRQVVLNAMFAVESYFPSIERDVQRSKSVSTELG